jgi:glycosyltransferase involved in cell wall biosynthesis
LLFAPKAAWHRLRGRVYRPDREPRYLHSLARQVQTRVRGLLPDVVFAPGSHSVARLDIACPIVFCADATFANVLDTYDSFSQCAPEFIAQGHAQERAALGRCAAAVFPSEWAARSAIDFYGTDPARVHVVPFGANVDAPDSPTVHNWIEHRDLSSLRVLFVGREWERKGADIVMAACEQLHSSGYDVSVDLVGIVEPPLPLHNWVRNHGLLDKRDPIQKRVLENLFAHAHFLFVPSRAEAYGMVFCEAAAYGLPNLTSTVGGIPSIVRHGHSGYMLPPDAPVQAWAAVLAGAMDSPEAYRTMARASRADYEIRLNWDAFVSRLVEIFASVIKNVRN